MKILQQTIFGTEEEQRQCCICGADMFEGFLHIIEGSTYCSKLCLHTEISKKEYEELYDAGICFWTNWEVK